MASPSQSEVDELQLFPTDQYQRDVPLKLKTLTQRVWTQHKAALVARYLNYFLYITKHGTYIDAFAGPQNDDDGGWAAELVLRLEPAWLRHFYFFEKDPTSNQTLEQLKTNYPGRDIVVAEPDDSNVKLPEFLPVGSVRAKEATFCLLDQRTFECSWALCCHIAALKPQGAHKVEQFYFLAQGWLDRAFDATSTEDGRQIIEAWWGRDDWTALRSLTGTQRALRFCERFRSELGYKHALPWPIYKNEGRNGSVMYFMIHATDHDEAPALMRRAYDKVLVPSKGDQLELDFGTDLAEFAGLAEAYPEPDAASESGASVTAERAE